MSLRVLSAALAVGIGLVGVVVAASPVAAVDPATPVQVAIAVPITVPTGSGGLISSDALAQYTSPIGTLTRQLDSVVGRRVTLGIDPRIVVSIRILGSAAPASATAWLARLSAAPNETFQLTYADSDITLATQAGSAGVLEPEGFDFAIDPTLFTESSASSAPPSTPTSTPSATPSATPGATASAEPVPPEVPPLPTSADLVSWPFSLTGIAWPQDATVVAADLPVITSSGYSTTILSSDNLVRAQGAGAISDIAGSRVLVSDSAVSNALTGAIYSSTATEWQDHVTGMSAAISASGLAQSGATATVFATLDRTVPTTNNRLAEAIDAAQADPTIELVGISSLLAATPTPATLTDRPQAAGRVALMRQLLDAQAAEVQFAGIARDPRAITSARRLELLALQSNGWSENPTGWTFGVAENLAESVDLRNSVHVESTGDFNFLAAAAPLPIAVSNKLDQAVTVYVTVRPDTGLLSVENRRVELVIEPNSQASAMIPAQAVSNGVVGVTVSLSSDTGVPIGGVSRARINVQAGWETPVVVIIAILVVAVFGGGLVRNIVRLRRAAAARGAGE